MGSKVATTRKPGIPDSQNGADDFATQLTAASNLAALAAGLPAAPSAVALEKTASETTLSPQGGDPKGSVKLDPKAVNQEMTLVPGASLLGVPVVSNQAQPPSQVSAQAKDELKLNLKLAGLKPWSKDLTPDAAQAVIGQLMSQAPAKVAPGNLRGVTEAAQPPMSAAQVGQLIQNGAQDPRGALTAQLAARQALAQAGHPAGTPGDPGEPRSLDGPVDLATLSRLLGEGDGELETRAPGSSSGTASRSGAGALSGREFLDTLSSLHGQDRNPGSPVNPGADRPALMAGGALSALQTLGVSGSPGADGKPALRVIEGGGALKGLGAGRKPGLAPGGGSEAGDLAATLALGSRAGSLAGSGSGPAGLAAKPVAEFPGQVTLGSGARERLATDSLIGISGGIRGLTPQGGGEMRIKLHPENLGELHLRVVTDGSQVSLHIQASDDRARKILEESLGHLRESLAQHQLTLGATDFTVAAAGQAQAGDNQPTQQQFSNPNPQNFSPFGSLLGGGQGQSGQGGAGAGDGWGGGERTGFAPETSRNPSATLAGAGGASRAYARQAGGRLDVRA